MSENKKRYNNFGLTSKKFGDASFIYGKMEGRVSNGGVTDASFTNNAGETVKRVRFYLGVPNRTDAISKTLGVDKSVLNPRMDNTNTNEYVSVCIDVYGYQCDWVLNNIKAGDIVQVTGELSKRDYNGKTYVTFTTYQSVDRSFNGNTKKDAPKGTEPDEPEAKTASVATPKPAAKPQAKPVVVVKEPEINDFDALDIDEEDLPF